MPDAYRLRRHPQPARDLGLRHLLGEQLRSGQPPLLGLLTRGLRPSAGHTPSSAGADSKQTPGYQPDRKSSLVHDGETVLEVPAKLSAQVRVFATGNGRKSDPVDAHSVA